jgi:hypothetical protein
MPSVWVSAGLAVFTSVATPLCCFVGLYARACKSGRVGNTQTNCSRLPRIFCALSLLSPQIEGEEYQRVLGSRPVAPLPVYDRHCDLGAKCSKSSVCPP